MQSVAVKIFLLKTTNVNIMAVLEEMLTISDFLTQLTKKFSREMGLVGGAGAD